MNSILKGSTIPKNIVVFSPSYSKESLVVRSDMRKNIESARDRFKSTKVDDFFERMIDDKAKETFIQNDGFSVKLIGDPASYNTHSANDSITCELQQGENKFIAGFNIKGLTETIKESTVINGCFDGLFKIAFYNGCLYLISKADEVEIKSNLEPKVSKTTVYKLGRVYSNGSCETIYVGKLYTHLKADASPYSNTLWMYRWKLHKEPIPIYIFFNTFLVKNLASYFGGVCNTDSLKSILENLVLFKYPYETGISRFAIEALTSSEVRINKTPKIDTGIQIDTDGAEEQLKITLDTIKDGIANMSNDLRGITDTIKIFGMTYNNESIEKLEDLFPQNVLDKLEKSCTIELPDGTHFGKLTREES